MRQTTGCGAREGGGGGRERTDASHVLLHTLRGQRGRVSRRRVAVQQGGLGLGAKLSSGTWNLVVGDGG